MTFHSYEPREGHRLAHDPMAAILGPRPIGWISTLGPEGILNLAPYAFFNIFNYTPPIVAFSSVGRKDTIRNLEALPEFVYNLVTRDLAEQMNLTSASVAPDVDEFAHAGLTARTSTLVAPPRVAETPVAAECRVIDIRELIALDGRSTGTWMVTAEVVQVHIASRLVSSGTMDVDELKPVLRAGGPADYFQVSREARFQMFRPR